MINHIDVGGVLRRSVCQLYTDLVTRPTGRAVRSEIEHQLAAQPGRTLTVIDFSQVGLLDFSCADEVIAKLLLRLRDGGGEAGYVVVRGVNLVHLDAIEAVLERHRLALIVETLDGDVLLVGELPELERRAWTVIRAEGRCAAAQLAAALGVAPDEAAAAGDALCRHGVAMAKDSAYVAITGRPQ